MNWKWHITVGVEKKFSIVLNKNIYEIFLNDDFTESKEYVGVEDGYDVIRHLTFEKVKIGYIEDDILNLYEEGIRILNQNPDLTFFILPILKKHRVEKLKMIGSFSLSKEILDIISNVNQIVK